VRTLLGIFNWTAHLAKNNAPNSAPKQEREVSLCVFMVFLNPDYKPVYSSSLQQVMLLFKLVSYSKKQSPFFKQP